MTFSAYQIESLLENFHQNNFQIEKSTRDTLNISENAKKDSLKFFKPSEESTMDWILPEDLCDLVEDKTTYDPIVNYVQQSRAGRFVDPVYIPKNPAPPFSLVSDHTNEKYKTDSNKKEFPQSLNLGNDRLVINEKSKNLVQENEKYDSEPNISEKSNTSTNTNKSYSDSEFQHVITAEDQNRISTKETKNNGNVANITPLTPVFGDINDEGKDEDFEFSSEELARENDDENDVVFGEGPIVKSSIIKFVEDFPDSAIKFLLRKNLDGRPLPIGYEDIYLKWEARGLSRNIVKGYLFYLMQWQEFPDIPVIEVLSKIREQLFDLKEKKE